MDKFYLQTCGCAMGRKYSLAYANIYLAEWEKKAFSLCAKKTLLYFRFLDDLGGFMATYRGGISWIYGYSQHLPS